MKNPKIFLAILALVLATSCGAYYRMITVLDKNGNAYREIYAHGNKEVESGKINKNPFLFELDSTWTMHIFDSVVRCNFFGEEREFNVIISKRIAAIEEFTKNLSCEENNRSLAAPEESLLKKNRWFYTKYSFKAVYHKLQYDVPVSIDDYLSREEQMLWTQGGIENYKAMNGSEMRDYFNNIDDEFLKWYGRNLFEISFESIIRVTTKYDLNIDKEEVYKQTIALVNDDFIKIDPELVCDILDSFYKTTYFSKLYNANSETLNNDFEKATTVQALIPNVISYELVLPGHILQTNAPIIATDTLIWKVDGMRLLFDDFTLTAEYRVANRWAFWVTGVLILLAVGSTLALAATPPTLWRFWNCRKRCKEQVRQRLQ
jgi:hypothetical protein